MFESAELGQTISKAHYQKKVPALRKKLLETQFAFEAASSFPLIMVVEGVDNVSKGEVINRLNEWFDTRGMIVQAFTAKSDEEAERPRFWRYWRALPAKGQMGIFAGSWYTGALIQRTFKRISKGDFDAHMERVASFENMLANDGALILKFWLHMSADQQMQKFKNIDNNNSPRWLVSGLDKKLNKAHKRYTQAAERAVRLTDTPNTPWHIIESADNNFRDITICETILKAIKHRLKQHVHPLPHTPLPHPIPHHQNILDHIDLSAKLEKKQYSDLLIKYQTQLNRLSWQAYHEGISMVLLFEGWDAAGKGGAIRRLTQAIDARISRVISVAAPTDEELAHHYLWRFWRHMPRAGHVTIYDRSWYGRVLVERIEGYASEKEWQRAYPEINDFEEQLHNHQIVLLKFWLHIDADEQFLRFKERENTPHKRHKLTEEDWRNREKWGQYEQAVHDMVRKTSTDYAPWTLIAGNDKYHARIQVLKTVCEQLQATIHKHNKKQK